MDEHQRQAAGAAVRDAMDARDWGAPQLAAMANVSVETVRDFLAGRRWPWPNKRAAIERALGWEPGRIAAIAKNAEGDPVRLALDRSELGPEDRYRVLSLYMELLSRHRRAAG